MAKRTSLHRNPFVGQRHGGSFQSKARKKETARCLTCGAAFLEGRWTWNSAPPSARKDLCPACRRMVYGYPAGFLHMSGPFFYEHSGEILYLLRHIEKNENADHPMERILNIQKGRGETLVITSGAHLARRMGEAVARAYHGRLTARYGEEDKSVRLTWER